MDASGLDIRFVLYVIVIPVIVIFGVVGNILSIIVLGKDRIQPSTAFSLRALSAADLVFLLSCLIFTTQPALHDKYIESLSLHSQTVMHLFILYSHPFYHAIQMASTWTLVLVTLERYILVCKPLHAVKFVTMKRLIVGVASIWISAVVFQIPLFFQTGCSVQHSNETTSCWEFIKTPDEDVDGKVSMTLRISSPLYHLIYRTLGYILLRFVLPFIVLIYLSARLAREIQRSRMRHDAIYASVHGNSNQGNPQERQSKYTRIVVTIVSLFCICLLPQAVFLSLLTLRNYRVLDLPPQFTFRFDAIASTLLTVNSSCNFIIFCIMRKNFRDLLSKMFFKRKRPLL